MLIFLLVILGCYLWYREQGTNKEIPKRAKLVLNYNLKGDGYR